MKNLCTYCKKPLVAFGNARVKGKSHNDWDDRTLHKKCWKQQKKIDNFMNYLKKIDEKV